MENERNKNAEAVVTPEIYFLISKFLADGPLQETARVLVRELEDKKVLPKRTDWQGNKHELTFKELEQKYSHIEPNHLLQICLRIGPMLDKELKPSVTGLCSLLGRGRQSLLRRQETIYRSRSLLDYCTRWHGASLPDSALTKPVHNFQNVLIGREYGGPVRHKMLVPTSFYSKSKLLRRTVGHLSSVYCVLFDRTGRYIITGADDLLIKIWSALDGRLLATLRGASAEITDIAINLDNTMLAAGSLDRVLRVWDLQTTCPIAVLTGHTGMITSVNFCPSPRSDMKYLVTTSTDGSIAFWQYSMPRGQKINFMPKPIQYHEKLRPGQAQMMCTTFSAGGMFLAAGSADHHVRVYLMSEDGPKRILETEVYTDAVDSVQWAHRGLRFISGSKDGTAHIWTFESQQWKNIKLSMTDRLPSCPAQEGDKKYKVTMVAWDCSDKYVITAVNDFTIKIWNSKNGKLHSVLRGHKDELYVLESNPKDEHVLLSAGHDGQVFLWDIERGISVAHFINDIDGQGHGGVFDAKWSPDGTMIAATDSHGHILIFGLGISPDKYKILPNELFFHTDYRPLLRDASHHVVDEQTQIMPHLMPPPFLVDADGNPHPAQFQRYVPGRESCSTDQLIPNFVIAGDGVVFEENPNQPNGIVQPPAVNANGNFSQIDRLIAALANRQSYAAPAGSQNHAQMERMAANRQGQQEQNAEPFQRSNSISRRSIAGLENGRISGDPERRPESVWGRPVAAAQQDAPNLIETMKFVRCTYVRPMKYCQLQHLRQAVFAAGQFEMQEYKREMRRRPIMINTASSLPSTQSGSGRQRNNRVGQAGGNAARSARRPRGSRQAAPTQAPAYRTRAVRDQEVEVLQAQREDEEEEDEESSGSSGDTSYSNVEEELESSDDSDTESSDYSDWVADTPGPNLEPPKRAKRKPLSRTRNMSDDSSDDNAEQAATTSANAASSAPKRSKNLIPKTGLNGEIPEIYRPAEWLSEVIPRKAPYYPQMGDEVVYFRQGHQRYLEAVRTKKVYKLSASAEPWNFRTLRDHEFVRVIGIKYEIRPPRLCCLKLAMMDEEGNMTGTSFKIKYHDMPDVLDFLVLRQTYDLAVQRNWSIGDRFRCMIGDGWWMGQIESRHPLSNEFPDSYFMCFHVRWDNGEYEYMSPWDMEPIDGNRLPDEVGGAVPVLPEEIRATLYQPKSEEWHRGDRDGSCRRIIAGMEQVMRLSIAEHFLAPVDLNIYPDYAFLIEYPIDLTTIKARFENHFYRRITSAQFDVRYLATNAEKYNRSHTNIVKHARIITDLCLRVIRDPNDMDVAAVYHQLVDVYHSSETENDNESDAVPSTSTGPSASVVARQKAAATRRSNRIRSDGDWRLDCRQLLDLLIRHPDSAPFREPVDTIEFPDYLEIIPAPMDLRTVKEDLLGGNYDDPLDFAKDVRLIFQNSRNYNTNTRSRIYSMTLRLSSLFEKQIKTVLSNWKAARRRANKGKPGSGRSSTKRSPPEKNRSAPQTRRNVKTTRRLIDSDDDDEDEDADAAHGYSRSVATKSRATLRNGNGVTRTNEASTSSSNNRVTSSSSHRLAAAQNGESQTRSSRRRAANKRRRRGDSDEDDDDDEEEEEAELDEDDDDEDDVAVTNKSAAAEANHATSSDDEEKTHDEDDDDEDDDDEDDDDDDDDDDHHSTDVHTSGHNTQASEQSSTAKTRRRGRGRRHPAGHGLDSQDSEESYKPMRRRRAGGRKPASNGRRRSNKRPGRRPKVYDDEATLPATSAGGNSQRQRTRGRPRYGASSMSDDIERDKSPPAHIDDTTQETPSHTPKKKGRPPKNRAAASNAEHNTASSNDPSKPSPTRLTRNNAYQPRRNAAVNDHSYHLPTRALRHLDSDTDSRENNARFTRRIAAQQPTHNWTEGSVEDESEEGEEILPTPTPTKAKTHESLVDLDDRPSTSRAALAAMRKSRLPPKLPAALHDDSDDSSDNVPLANTQSSENSNGARRHDSRMGNGQVSSVATRYATNVLTRSHATSTTTASVYTTTAASSSSRTAATAAAGSTSAAALPSIHDHNYLGSSAGTRSRDTQRFSRVGLSRHQRDASELDTSLDPLESSLLLGSTSTRLQAASSSTTATIDEAQQSVRRGRSRFSQQSEPEAGNGEVEDDVEEEEDDDEVDSDAAVQDEEHSDSEDDQPLTSYVVQKKRRGRRPKAAKARRAKRRSGGSAGGHLSDDYEEENYDPRNHLSSRKRRHHEEDYSATNGNRNSHRGTRNIKRPRYNEQTDEEEGGGNDPGARSVAAGAVVSRSRGKLSTNTAASPHKNRDEQHHDDDDDATSTDSDEQLVSVSSRGRVRKITARARRIFKD